MVKPELMAPAGDFISLRAAINAGADAVYFGVASINMRSNAKNFLIEDIEEISQICHENNVKAYLALNTIIYDSELELASKIINVAKNANIDAIICWDFAIISMAKQADLNIFISTQMSVANSSSIIFFYENFGIKRYVLARECTLKDIRRIKNNLSERLGDRAKEIEIEVFAHGAMCVSVSGRCFMSQFHFNKSGNRGECKQPCRREYTITDERDGKSYILGKDHVMSPKDLCIMPFIEKVLEANVQSFKIEGRGRSPEYVDTTTSCYRKAIDYYFENKDKPDFKENFKALKEDLYKQLDSVFNRGFSPGFFMGKPIDEWTGGNGSKSSHRKVQIGYVTNFYKKPMVVEIKVEGADFEQGQELMFQGKKTGVITLVAKSIEIEHKEIKIARQGTFVGVKIDEEVRRNDKVFKIVPVENDDNAS